MNEKKRELIEVLKLVEGGRKILNEMGIPYDEQKFYNCPVRNVCEVVKELEADSKQLRECIDYLRDSFAKMKEETGMSKWKPIKTRPMTKEEMEYFAEQGYSEDSILMLEGELPEDGQDVLVTTISGHVTTDTFLQDGIDCYFECYDNDEVIAWMPFPEAYKAESEE